MLYEQRTVMTQSINVFTRRTMHPDFAIMAAEQQIVSAMNESQRKRLVCLRRNHRRPPCSCPCRERVYLKAEDDVGCKNRITGGYTARTTYDIQSVDTRIRIVGRVP